MPRAASRRLPLRSFAVYYGYGPLPGLERMDLAILEPAGWRPQDVQTLRQHGVRTLAYLSAMEVTGEVLREAGLVPADLLRPGGRPWQKEDLGVLVADPRSVRWRRHLQARAQDLLAAGWDGLFLDTLGDVEDPLVAPMGGWLVPAAAELVRLIRGAAGDALLVQNHGILLLLPLVAPYLDGICWESPPLGPVGREAWVGWALENMAATALHHRLPPLLVGLVPPGPEASTAVAALEALATRYGGLAYSAPGDYTSGVRLPDGSVVVAAR